jgi:hypothetical protein
MCRLLCLWDTGVTESYLGDEALTVSVRAGRQDRHLGVIDGKRERLVVMGFKNSTFVIKDFKEEKK